MPNSIAAGAREESSFDWTRPVPERYWRNWCCQYRCRPWLQQPISGAAKHKSDLPQPPGALSHDLELMIANKRRYNRTRLRLLLGLNVKRPILSSCSTLGFRAFNCTPVLIILSFHDPCNVQCCEAFSAGATHVASMLKSTIYLRKLVRF